MTEPNTISIETRDAIEILTLNRPAQLNAVTPEMIEAGLNQLAFYRPSEDDEAVAEEIICAIYESMTRCRRK